MSDTHATGVAYLTVRRDWRNGRKVNAVKVTSKPPTAGEMEDVVIKLNLRIPQEAFRPLDGGTVDITIDQVHHELEVRA